MNSELQTIKDSWDNRPAAGTASSGEDGEALSREDKSVVALADSYVKSHPEVYSGFEEKTLPECVRALETFRDAGLDEQSFEVQVWIWHRFEFQTIGGPAEAQVRIVPTGGE